MKAVGSTTKRRKTPKWIRRPGRALSENRVFAAVLARFAVAYLKFTFRTNSWVVEPEDALQLARDQLPAIAAVWHGQHVLLPAVPIGIDGAVMISKSIDGEITARVAEAFGARAIRASGGRDSKKVLQKGGIAGFLEMSSVLENGESVLQTADIPKGAPRKAGLGIVMLAKHSGRPIIPLAVASSRRIVFRGAWDRTTFNLPFGRSAIVMGEPLTVNTNSNDATLETARQTLEVELNRITKRAYDLTGNPE